MTKAGSWLPCTLRKAHKRVSVFYWREWDRSFNFCDLCLDEIQKENKTGAYAIRTPVLINHKSPDSKPEKNSL